MFAFTFLNPLLLWALPLCAVPVIIHLLNRRRFQRVPWAAMEFLLAAMKRNRKRLRMEQWLVLLLRVLAVLLLVALVSRPQLGGALGAARTHHVVVLDDSASMTQRRGATSLFERGQERIRAMVDDLVQRRDGDIVSLVRASRPQQPELWNQRVGPDLGRRVGALLAELRVGHGSPDLGQALQLTAQRAAAVTEASRTEYYLVTDQRAHDWQTPDDKPRAALLAALAGLRADRDHVTVLATGGQHHNLAVAEIRALDRVVVAGVPAAFAVEIVNHSLDPAAATTVALEVDGRGRVSLAVPALAPGERQSLPFTHTFHEAGPARIEAQLEATEMFPLDDRRTFVLEVRDKSRVLLVDGEPDVDDGEAAYLQAALDPGGEAVSGIEPQVVPETALADLDLEPFDVVWLANVATLAPSTAAKLEAFVAAGGGLVVAAGPAVDGARYNELLWRDGKGVLPLPFGDTGGDPDRPEHAALVQKDHPLCGPLGEIFELLTARVVLVKRWLALAEDGRHGASVVMRIRGPDGPPLLVTKPFGTAGEVAQLAVTADAFWSNLPRTDLFVPLVNQLHRFAARRRDRSGDNLGPDGVYAAALDPAVYRADAVVRSTVGDGEERTFTAVEAAPAAGAPATASPPLQLTVPMAELHLLGAYEVELSRHDGVPERRWLARQAAPAESQLAGFPAAAFARLYPPEVQAKVAFVGDADAGGLGADGEQGELWPWFAALLLAGLLLESLLAWRFGRR